MGTSCMCWHPKGSWCSIGVPGIGRVNFVSLWFGFEPEGQVLVAEFGGCRVHEVSLDTESFRTWSAEESNGLRYPWPWVVLISAFWSWTVATTASLKWTQWFQAAP